MTTDNRVNEPTEAQVEAAAKEYAWNGSMRAALVAAQEAAPVLPSSPVDDALGMIDRTLDSISEFGTTWQHHEVVRMLNDIRGALTGKEKNDECTKS